MTVAVQREKRCTVSMRNKRPAQVDRIVVPGVLARPVQWTNPKNGERWVVTVMWQTDPSLRPVGVTVAAYGDAEPVGEDGDYQLEGVPASESDPPELAKVTRGLFGDLPMARMIEASRTRLLSSEARVVLFDEDDNATLLRTEKGSELLEAHREERRRRSAERSPYGSRDEWLALVAEAYRTAVREQPRRASARTAELLTERGTYGASGDDGRVRVRKWIAEARRAGLIPKTTERRAGWSENAAARRRADTTDDRRD